MAIGFIIGALSVTGLAGTLANDLEPAFGDLREDARFRKHASGLRATLDSTLAAPPLNCAGVSAAIGKVGEACKACHQDFRG